MSEPSVYFDITADGRVSVHGFPPEFDAAVVDLLARGLTGYFRHHGLTGPEHAQQRLDAFYMLLKSYGIDTTGTESGIMQ
jgi:hypothetical protein